MGISAERAVSSRQDWQELAHVLYCLITGNRPRPASLEGSYRLVKPAMPSVLKLYDSAESFQEISRSSRLLAGKAGLIDKWLPRFDNNGYLRNHDDASDFIRDYYNLYWVYGLGHQQKDVACSELISRPGGLLEEAVIYTSASDRYVFSFTLSGSATVADNKVMQCGRNDLILIPPTCKCRLERTDNAALWHSMTGSFRMRSLWVDLVDWIREFNRPYRVKFDDEAASQVRATLGQLIKARQAGSVWSGRLAENLLEQVLIRARMAVSDTTEFGDLRIINTLNFLVQNIDREITHEQLAARLNISVSHFKALFSRETGMGLTKWRTNVRLEHAAHLLRKTSLSVKDISQRVGFNDQLYFSRRFRQRWGCAPSEYRRTASTHRRPSP